MHFKHKGAPPPSPIPTGKGSRSAADPTFSEYIDKSIVIPELTLPQQAHLHRFSSKPEEISYQSLRAREDESVRGLLRSGRQFGVFRITDHGISGDELRFALASTERIFGLTIGCCTSYGDHEMLVWPGGGGGDDDGDRRVTGEVGGVIGEHNFQIFRQKMETVANQLRSIAEELAKDMAQYGPKQFQEPIRLGESKLSIYRYHRANIIDRISSVVGETSQELRSFALSLHLLLEPGDFSLQSDGGNLSFNTRPDTVVVTIGKELEEWSHGEFKSAQGKLLFKPFLHTNKPSFSIEQKWSISNLTNAVGESNKIVSLSDQILIVLVIAVLCNSLIFIVDQN